MNPNICLNIYFEIFYISSPVINFSLSIPILIFICLCVSCIFLPYAVTSDNLYIAMLSFPISGIPTHISPCICLYFLIVFLFLSLCFPSFIDSFYYNLYYLFMCQSVTLLPFLVTLVITVFNFLVFM